jgi:hypothetical protein
MPGPEARVVELLDQGLDGLLGLEEHGQEHGLEREPLDPLGRPLGAQLGAGDAPDLLGVGLEEDREETVPEAVGHPLLEGVLLLVGPDLPAQVAQHHQDRLDDPEAHQGVERLERVVEEAVVVEDPRHAGPAQELAAEHLLPDLVHLVHLGEEAVAAHVEVIALVLERAGKPAHVRVLLEHGGPVPELGQLAGGGEARGSAADDHDIPHDGSFAAATPSKRSISDSPFQGRGWARVNSSVEPRYRESTRTARRGRDPGGSWL